MAAPPRLDELDPPTLTALLRRHDPTFRAVVSEVRAEPLGVSTGFLGQLRRLHLSYAAPVAPDTPAPPGLVDPPPTLVAKAPTQDPGGLQVGSMLDVWARESRFFSDLAAEAQVRVPRCYANEGDRTDQRWLLLLEDVGDTEAAPQAEGATFEQAEAALREIAVLHRRFLGRRPAGWLPGFDRGPFDALQHSVEAAVEPFTARFGSLLPAGGAEALRRFAPRLSAWAAEMARGPLTVTHADYRLDNLVIVTRPDRTEVVVLDWQTTLMGRGEMDVSSLLVTSLTPPDRRAWEQELIAGYAMALGRPREEVLAGVRTHLQWWMALYANNLSRIDPADARGTAMFQTTVQRTFEAARDHGLFESVSDA